ncbi:DUF1553 domain-containing protein [bacterium]|nr:DUF1553 domain-containing protein [bacterium]
MIRSRLSSTTAIFACVTAALLLLFSDTVRAAEGEAQKIDFNRQIRSILSNRCFACHGPDEEEREADLRFDTAEGALADLGGHAAIVPGKPEESTLVERITSTDPDLRMPPASHGEPLSPTEVKLLTEWIRQGAKFEQHWSYVKPVRPELPAVKNTAWVRNEIDRFILARLEREGLAPTEETDRYALIRRVSLDLTGLPPSLEEVDQFIADKSADAYEKLVDRLLDKETYGEHWARRWLDLARYADSAGYADDPPRTIWAFRDYVIKSLNANKPFDRFTIEQIAGDLLPDPTEDQLIATAFHRNTMTNNEGGTNDEEFRNVAIVDRVNTTMAVWMGTTIACCQCHNHKYDPLTQAEFYELFAFFNDSQDADRRDESPLLQLFTDDQKQNREDWTAEVADLRKLLSTPTPELLAAQAEWEKRFSSEPAWQMLKPSSLSSQSKIELTAAEDGTIKAADQSKTDVFTVEIPVTTDELAKQTVTALRLETQPGPNFVISRVLVSIVPPDGTRLSGRFVRVELPGKQKMLSLAEVQAFNGNDNVAVRGKATQSSTDFGGPPELAIDGNTDGDYQKAKSTTHTANSDNPWWEVDLTSSQPIDRIVVWNRTDGNLQSRLNGFVLKVLDENRKELWSQTVAEAPQADATYALSAARGVKLAAAYADYSQDSFAPEFVLNNLDTKTKGWAVGGQTDRPHQLTLIPAEPLKLADGETISVTIEQVSQHEKHTLTAFRLSATSDEGIAEFARTPAEQLAILRTVSDQRSDDQKQSLTQWYLGNVAPALAKQRQQLAKLEKQLADLKPATSVPIMRDLPPEQHRKTQIQLRGNWQNLGEEVSQGVPTAFHPLDKSLPKNRLALAEWLIDENNPLTPRVISNRYWEAVFGAGIVSTSEEFGSQGDLPIHPELLDWLAVELVDSGWNLKHLLKLMVTSAAYRQSSRVTDDLLERDPQNRLLARGPRFRISAEMVRDQALAVSGLLSSKMYGAPVRPPQPSMGLSAAFGSGIDWQTSAGDDRYRRGLYTTWRRSNPYPSMAAFDAPNREVCALKRDRTNSPLQALVTLNDPVYVEAAQALARLIASHDGSRAEKATFAFRRVVTRPPNDAERDRLVQLYESSRNRFAAAPENAKMLATDPLGPLPDGADAVDLAAWTLVSNVLLNLDEVFMKR